MHALMAMQASSVVIAIEQRSRHHMVSSELGFRSTSVVLLEAFSLDP